MLISLTKNSEELLQKNFKLDFSVLTNLMSNSIDIFLTMHELCFHRKKNLIQTFAEACFLSVYSMLLTKWRAVQRGSESLSHGDDYKKHNFTV